ncbi:putative Zinc finger, RanBP2-type, Zinc finger, PHD-type, uvrABC system, subunit B [Plasmopara halstedii]
MEEEKWDDALLSEIEALEKNHINNHSSSNQAQKQCESADISPLGEDWSCKSCTLLNNASKTACQVCGTLRSQFYEAPGTSTAVKKTVQACLSFDGTSLSLSQPQDSRRSNNSLFAINENEKLSQETLLCSKTAGAGLVLTSKRSDTSCINTPAVLPLQISQITAGEDPVAKTRYLDIETRPSFPKIDYEAAQHFVFPTNYSIREYQLTVAEKALYHNTLVSLPTGLGKTLVAAVVMYNFYCWFPTGMIVFMAPTKPLVAQQIQACHEIMGIPLSDTAELQGNVPPAMRRVLWNTRRVFFCTPQSLQNDLRRGVCNAERFVCVVVDEAHRATGNYAYCCVVQEIEAKTPFFRVLALSATPGAKFDVIQDVVSNLRISHIESRSADDPDVRKYTHARQEEVIVCRLGIQLLEIKMQFLKIFTPIIQRLSRKQIIQNSNPDKLTSWYVLQAREKFRNSPDYASNRSAESDLALLVSLLHAKSLLTGHGLNSFRDQIIHWVEERRIGKMSWSKKEMLYSPEFQKLEESLAIIADGSSSTASHPKLVKLREVLLEHFQRHTSGESSTRAIVFTQYRASVSEIVALLRPFAPLLNVQSFIGQGASGKDKENKGQSQKVQQDIVRKFRLGEYNVLVATCIAEEGLDIGEVDLIVSFDALTSPVRMIQRMGRTGRKRVGKVIVLVTEGEEQKKLARSASASKTVSRALTTFKSRFTYSKCPRMLPDNICPKLRKLEMKIPNFHASQVGGKSFTTALDPNLWQLSDAERAVAELKYFPPNFASTLRTKLYPVYGNRSHLLRRRTRCLTSRFQRDGVRYSARSLILQSLVRKVHGVDENLEKDFEFGDGLSVDTEEKRGLAAIGNPAQSLSQESICGSLQLKSHNKYRRSRSNLTSVEFDNEIGSAELDVTSLGKYLLAPMEESMLSCELHFSPQFVDSASQLVPVVVGKDEQPMFDTEECIGVPIRTSTTAKCKPDSTIQETPRAVCMSTVSILDKVEEQETQVVAGGDLIKSQKNLSKKEEVRQESDSAKVLAGASRNCRTRQLTFDDVIVDACPQNQSQSDEHSLIELATETRRQSEINEVSGAEDDDSSAFSFVLLPTLTNAMDSGNTKNETSKNDESTCEKRLSSAHIPSFRSDDESALNNSIVLLSSASPERKVTLNDDSTDRHEADIKIEANLAAMNQVARTLGPDKRGANFTDLKDDDTIIKVMEPGTLKKTTPSSSWPDTVFQQAKRSERKEADSELVDDEYCAICLESESYDDDPIVFCDGCNVAVHQYCYGIHTLPSDKWFCAVCIEAISNDGRAASSQPHCLLCPHRGGAYKRTACRQWVHVQCFLWIPELSVEQKGDDLLALGDIKSLDPDRKTLDCSLCHSQKGYGIIQCAHNQCLTAFHVSCAAFAHYRMDQVESCGSEGGDNGCDTLFLAYCPLHRNSVAPCYYPQQEKTPVAANKRRRSPPSPMPSANISSPSYLLVSPADSEQKFKTFRRLKRKYDYQSQSEILSQNGAQTSLVATSPSWQKHIKRSKRRREMSRVLTAAYIDNMADVQGGGQDDDEDDEYEDDSRGAADDSFIDDSSQLSCSQSFDSSEENGNRQLLKKKKSKPDMRAIYARSLFESQHSPLMNRRGGRHFKALPSNGIIRACLDEMRDRPEMTSVVPAPARAISILIESDEDDSAPEADSSPSFDLLKAAKSIQSVDENPDADKAVKEMTFLKDTPSSSFIKTGYLISSTRPGKLKCSVHDCAKPFERHLRKIDGSSQEPLQKIEADRLKPIQKFEDCRQAELQCSLAQGRVFSSGNTPSARERDFQSACVNNHRNPCSHSQHSMTSTVDLTRPLPEKLEWIIYVNTEFSKSNIFSEFLSAKNVDCTIVVVDSTEADALVSVRTAVLIVTSQQLNELALASLTKNVANSQRVGMLMAMHQKIIIAIVQNSADLPDLQQLRQLSNASVIIQPHPKALCVQLHQMAYQERLEGYELPFPSLCQPNFSFEGANALDADFASRLKFFRSISHISLDSALSLSFRFKNFSAMQVPVSKFNEMHWRRMLPWISKTTAEKIRQYVQQNQRH